MSRAPGPAPESRELRILKGNPGKRPLPPSAPQPRKLDKVPPAPTWLGKEAKREYRRLADVLHPIGLLTSADLPVFHTLCSMYGEMVEARREVEKEGRTIVLHDQGGHPIKAVANPAVTIARNAAQQLRMLAAEFGLTPNARGRMQMSIDADPVTEEDEDLD